MTKKDAIVLQCERPVAYKSPDHIVPWGTKRDNSTNKWFNAKLYRIYSSPENPVPVRILDMGCSGGGFVKECLDDGHFAIGLEGSDYSLKHQRAEWRTIPEHLFTCDITGKFELFQQAGAKRERLLFNVVTSWEVMEHITEKDLIKVAENVKRHLAKDGMWIMSIAPVDDIVNGVNLHQTVKPKRWWVEKFRKMGFEVREDFRKYFDGHFVRGGKNGAGSFNLVVTLPGNKLPPIPRESVVQKAVYKWRGSKPQKVLKLLVTGEAGI